MKSMIALSVLIGSCMIASAQDRPQRERQGPPPEILKEFDKDGDGKLSEEERATMRETLRARAEQRRKKMLKKYDKDGDGKLSPEERAQMREDMQKRRQELIAKYDKDGDGRLSPEERAAIPAAERWLLTPHRERGEGPQGRPQRGERGEGPQGRPQRGERGEGPQGRPQRGERRQDTEGRRDRRGRGGEAPAEAE